MMDRSHKSRLSIFAMPAIFMLVTAISASGQEIVDKTVAVVSDSSRTELITYSDLVWQLALQPGTPLDPPRSGKICR